MKFGTFPANSAAAGLATGKSNRRYWVFSTFRPPLWNGPQAIENGTWRSVSRRTQDILKYGGRLPPRLAPTLTETFTGVSWLAPPKRTSCRLDMTKMCHDQTEGALFSPTSGPSLLTYLLPVVAAFVRENKLTMRITICV